jgi:hypothetical protein
MSPGQRLPPHARSSSWRWKVPQAPGAKFVAAVRALV